MFGRFRKSKLEKAIAESHVGKSLDQLALAAVVSRAMSDYFRANKIMPIIRNNDASVLELWNGTRLEAISKLWNFESPKLDLIIDPTQHPKLLNTIIESGLIFRPHSATGNEEKDSISAILQVYDYLDQLETEVSARRSMDPLDSDSKYASFIIEMRKLHIKWQGFSFALATKAHLPKQPDTMFAAVWRDITFRAKMIALCKRFGTSYMAVHAAGRKLVMEEQSDLSAVDNLWVKILSADDPDDVQEQ